MANTSTMPDPYRDNEANVRNFADHIRFTANNSNEQLTISQAAAQELARFRNVVFGVNTEHGGTQLRLRDTAGGNVISKLKQGANLKILHTMGATADDDRNKQGINEDHIWVEVEVDASDTEKGGKKGDKVQGWVSTEYIKSLSEPVGPLPIPVAEPIQPIQPLIMVVEEPINPIDYTYPAGNNDTLAAPGHEHDAQITDLKIDDKAPQVAVAPQNTNITPAPKPVIASKPKIETTPTPTPDKIKIKKIDPKKETPKGSFLSDFNRVMSLPITVPIDIAKNGLETNPKIAKNIFDRIKSAFKSALGISKNVTETTDSGELVPQSIESTPTKTTWQENETNALFTSIINNDTSRYTGITQYDDNVTLKINQGDKPITIELTKQVNADKTISFKEKDDTEILTQEALKKYISESIRKKNNPSDSIENSL